MSEVRTQSVLKRLRGVDVRRALLCSSLFCAFAISCGGSFSPSSQVDALRVLAVRADPSYVQPGETVSFQMTAADALGDEARPIQVAWLGGCVNPPAEQYFACYAQLGEIFANFGSSDSASQLLSIQEIAPDKSGSLDASVFEWTMPDDIVSSRPAPEAGPHYGVGFLFFAACAGTLAPADLSSEGSVPAFPLVCLDEDGERLGPDSFVPGYTQVYAFADERTNEAPQMDGLTFDGEDLSADPAEIIEVETCAVSIDERREEASGCGAEPLNERCTEHSLKAIIGDVAEANPDATLGQDGSIFETVWVEYFTDGGSLDRSLKLVSDAQTGYVGEHETAWFAPVGTGIVNIWAVARDQRGGSTIVHRQVNVVAP